MILILTCEITNRLEYIAGVMAGRILGIELCFTTSLDEFVAWDGPKMVYSREPSAPGLFIKAADLLFETSLEQKDVACDTLNGTPVLFATDHADSALPFDPFAAGFYMTSRYEEYGSAITDEAGRFPATESIAWREKFLDIPVVHHWAGLLGKLLRTSFPGIKEDPPEYRYVPTVDIDHAWCYLERPLLRTIGGVGRSLFQGSPEEISGRIKTLLGKLPDLYDNYNFIHTLHSLFGQDPLFFILFADYGGNDNNVSLSSEKFHRLIRSLDSRGGVGIHPSLASALDLTTLLKEFRGLGDILGRKITASRQHFLKFSLPGTYRDLIALGVTDDYSMGYASLTGFRAGISIPFPFFNLETDEETNLLIHPVSVMDVTLKDYLRLTPAEGLEVTANMIETIRTVNGEFVSLWHNESLGETGPWKGWREVYEQTVKLASP